MPSRPRLLLLMAAGLSSSACSHTLPPVYGPPLPPRPARVELLHEFAKLQPTVQACSAASSSVKRLVQLHVDWPETAPVVFSAVSSPVDAQLEVCVTRAARAAWVRVFGDEWYEPRATQFSVYFRVQ